MSIIKTLHYEYYEDFIRAVEDKYYQLKEKDDYNSIDIIAKYDDAKEIIQELVCAGYGIVNIDLTEPIWNDYDDAFVISLFENGIWCEPVKRKDDYIFVEADVVYIFSDCNSKIIDKIEADEIYEVDGDDEDCDCENCNCCNVNTTTTSSATYKVNGKSVDRDVFIDRFTEAIDSFVKWQNVSSKLLEELLK